MQGLSGKKLQSDYQQLLMSFRSYVCNAVFMSSMEKLPTLSLSSVTMMRLGTETSYGFILRESVLCSTDRVQSVPIMPLFHWLDLASSEELRTALHVVCCISKDPLLLR
ncbi:hypothetical protein XENORESO_019432 [Xenotaenia resolanae]|uniref:Uncharacterized protein n=1 Tax=Xenotaenia resolanae TaxID=208358 RepID=A0ABV0WIM7_9TELE